MDKNNWTYKKLGEVYDVRDGTHDSPSYISEGFPLVTSKNLRNGIIDMSNINYISEQDYRKINERSKVDVGDVLFAMIGTIGNPVLVTEEPNYAIKNMALFKVPENQCGKFLFYFLSSKITLDKMKMDVRGGTQRFVSLKYLRNFCINLPKIEEQNDIVAELDLLSSIIDKKKAQLKELDQLAQSIFYDMFGDPITNEKGWESTTIGKCCMLKSGNSDANNSSLGTLPYVKVGDMNIVGNETYIITSSTFVDREENKKNIFPIGTTIFPKRGGAILTNKKRITNVEICCDLNVMGVIPNREKLHPLYIYFYFLKLDFAVFGKTGSTIPQINNHNIAPMKIGIPPLPLQQEFASKIEAIERQKSLIQQSIVETQTLFDSRMDHWFG